MSTVRGSLGLLNIEDLRYTCSREIAPGPTPLSSMTPAFSVFTTGQGKEGIMGQASKQQLENAFGSSKDVDVVTEILEKGQMQEVSGGDKKYSSTNDSQRGGNSVSRGAQGGYGGR